MDSSGALWPLEWLESVTPILDRLGCRWVVAGAAAAAQYRIAPRYTTDLDLLVTWHPRIPTAFEEAGFAVRQIASPGEEPHLVIVTRDAERTDLIIAVVEYQALAIHRGEADRYLTAEDVIVHKLIAWRPRDRDDIASILAAGHRLDTAYISHWAAEWGVADRWEKATSVPGDAGRNA